MSNGEINSFLNLTRRKQEQDDRCNSLILTLLADPLSPSTGKARKFLLLVSAVSFLFTIGNLFPSKIDALGLDIQIADRIIIIRIMLILLIYFLLSFNFYSFGDYTSWGSKMSQLKSNIEELNSIKRQINSYEHTKASLEKDPLAGTKKYKKLVDDVKETTNDKLKTPLKINYSKYPRETIFLILRVFWEFGLPDLVAIFALILLIIKQNP